MKMYRIFLVAVALILAACNQQLTTEEYIKNGEVYSANKEWKSAIIEFKNAIKQSPDNAQARALLGGIYLNTYNSNAAIKELKKAIDLGIKDEMIIVLLGKAYEQLNQNENILAEIKPEKVQTSSVQADVYAIRAKAFLRSGQVNKAKKALDQAKLLDNNTTYVRLAWAQYESRKNNEEAQRQWLEPLLERDGGIADAWSQMAQIEQESREFQKAETAYSRAISLRKVVHIDYVKRALLRISQKNYSAAHEDIKVVKKAGATWPVVGHAEGLLAYHQANYESSLTQFDKVLSKYPDYLPSRLFLGLTNFQRQNYQSAVTNLELYLSKIPYAYQANFIYAASLIKVSRVQDAIRVLEKLAQSQPDNYKILALLGNAYLLNKQNEKGIQLLKKVVSLKPDQATTRFQLGSALMHEDSGIAQAQQELIKAIELDSELFQADLALFMSYIRNKDYIKARKVASELKLKQQNNSLGSNLLAISYLSDSKKEQAVIELENTLKSFPADPLTSDNLAKVYIHEKQLGKAKRLYREVLDVYPDNLKSYIQMALISAMENDQPAVINWLKKAVEHNPKVLSTKLLLATQYLRKNDPKAAIQLLQASTEEQKQQPGYILLMAKAKMSTGEYEHANRALKSLLIQEPDLTSAQILLAQSYAQLNKKNMMRKVLEEAVQSSPDNLQIQLLLARLDLYEQKITPFKNRVSSLIKQFPESKDVQFLNAKIQSSEKGYEGAISTLAEIMTELPHSDVAVDLARNQWASGDKSGAISGLEIWLQKKPTDNKALMVLAQFYLTENRISEAKNAYQTLDQQLPDNSIVLNNLAWIMKDSDVNQGIVYAQKALKVDPENPYVQDTLAMLYLENSEAVKALKISKKAASLLPRNYDIQMNYSKILIANNKKDEAKQVLKKLLVNEPSSVKRNFIEKELNRL